MGNVVTFDKMQVGQKGGGKHWTKDEVEAREQAAQKMKRKKKPRLKMPDWLDENAAAVWKKTIKDMKDLDLLDRADEDVLAVYCNAVARHKEYSCQALKKMKKSPLASVEMTRAAQSFARLIIQYADKLGLNPNSRARLAKKIADKGPDPNADLFD